MAVGEEFLSVPNWKKYFCLNFFSASFPLSSTSSRYQKLWEREEIEAATEISTKDRN
jgi:hypothetical protein